MKLFESRFKFPLHMVELAFILGALGATAARMFIFKASANAPKTRASTMALSMVRFSPSASSSTKLTLSPGRQIYNPPPLPSPHRKAPFLEEMGLSQSIPHHQRVRDRILGRRCIYAGSSQYSVLRRHELYDQLGCSGGCGADLAYQCVGDGHQLEGLQALQEDGCAQRGGDAD